MVYIYHPNWLLSRTEPFVFSYIYNMQKKIKNKKHFFCVEIRSKNKKSGILNAYIEKMSKKGDEKIYAMCRDKRR